MSTINRVPWGLQDVLGNTNFGDNPSVLAKTTVPTYRIDRHLKFELLTNAVASGALTNTTDTIDITVPDGEVWELIQVSSRVSGVATTELYQLTILLTALNSSNDHFVATTRKTDSTQIGSAAIWNPPDQPLIGGGTVLKSRFFQAVGLASLTVTMSALYYRYRV